MSNYTFMNLPDLSSGPFIHCPREVATQVSFICSLKKEHFVGLYLNVRNKLLHMEIIAIGTLTASLVHPREVFEPAVRHSAAAVIISHNHPSGESQPSDADIKITHRLVKAGKVLGIDLIDHVIVTKSSFLSMCEEGYL